MNFTELAAAGVSIDICIAGEILLFHFQWKNQHYKHGILLTEVPQLKSVSGFEDALIGLVMRELGGVGA